MANQVHAVRRGAKESFEVSGSALSSHQVNNGGIPTDAQVVPADSREAKLPPS